MTTERTRLLEVLIHRREPLGPTLAALRCFGWDSDDELATLRRADLRAALESYLDGDLRDTDLTEWAEALAGRDDIGLEPGAENILKDALFALSTPELVGPISAVVAAEWRDRLSAPTADSG